MGEWSQFEPGHRAPNDGVYIETGEDDFHTGINNPKQITLHKGDKFPSNSKKDRKWVRKKF